MVIAALLCALSLSAADAQPASKKVVASFTIPERGSNPEIVFALIDALRDLGNGSGQMTVLNWAVLEDRLERDPVGAIKACAENMECIADLGTRAGAHEVLRVWMRPVDNDPISVRMQLAAFNSQTAKRVRAIDIYFPDAAEVENLIIKHWQDIFGQPPPAGLAEGMALSKEDSFAIQGENIDALPASALSLNATPAPKSFWDSPHVLTYSGIGVGGLGAVAMAVAAYHGQRLRTLNEELASTDYGPQGSTQVHVQKTVESANRAAQSANLWWQVGGAGLLVGTGLVLADIFLFEGDDGTSVGVSSDGHGAGLEVRWLW